MANVLERSKNVKKTLGNLLTMEQYHKPLPFVLHKVIEGFGSLFRILFGRLLNKSLKKVLLFGGQDKLFERYVAPGDIINP